MIVFLIRYLSYSINVPHLLPLSITLTTQELTFDKFSPTFPEIIELNMRLEEV